MRTRARQAGFTLVELMVVVTIIGILAGVSLTAFKGRPVGDGARMATGLMNEARRRAQAAGPVRADVAAANGIRYRERVEYADSGAYATLFLCELTEDAAPATTYKWVQLSYVTLPAKATIRGVSSVAASLPGGTVPGSLAAGTVKYFYPDGSADAHTVWLATRGLASGETYRITVMPLTGSAEAYAGW